MAGDIDKQLYDAAFGKKWSVAVKLVVEKGATNSYRDGLGDTALHAAAKSNSGVGLIESILKKQPDQKNIENNYGWTPLRKAIFFNAEDCIKTIMRFKPNSTILHVFGDIENNKFKYFCHDKCQKSMKTILKCEQDPVAAICRDFTAITKCGGYEQLAGNLANLENTSNKIYTIKIQFS